MNKFYITTSIVYTNAQPHIGFALELFQTDAIARLHRLLGYDVKFLTGTDEHGLKIYRKAETEGKSPQQFVDEVAAQVQQLAQDNQVSNTDFVRTTDQQRHWPAAQKLWQKLAANNLLEKRKYSGLYCVGCERYIREDELNERGQCPDHLTEPEHLDSENYFFKLSSFTESILTKIDSGELEIHPEERRHEIIKLLEGGLEDVSFSRDINQMPWGIPVPDDPGQVMYVWCDALTNYISALGYADETEEFLTFWPADTHMIGKDILRFHAAIWPAMLMAAELPLPKKILVHGFIQSGGQRMSKSIGNVINPFDITEKYGSSALRLILLKEIPAFKDGDLTNERISELYQSELANKLGNLISRVVAMTNKYFSDGLPANPIDNLIKINLPDIRQFEIDQSNYGRTDILIEQIWQMIESANQFVENQKPWELAKQENSTQLAQVILNLLETIRIIALLLESIDPITSGKILDALGQKKYDSSQNNPHRDRYLQALNWGGFDTSAAIKPITPLFPRIEDEDKN